MPISKQQILSAMRAAARKLGHAPTRSEFMRLSGIHYCRLMPYFSGFRAAVRAAGLEPHPHGVRIDTAAMLRDWGRLARKLGRVPTRDEYERHGRYASASFETRFHRWSQVRTSFLEFADTGGLGPLKQWADVVEKIRNGPVPARGGGRRWLKQFQPTSRKASRRNTGLVLNQSGQAMATVSAPLPPPLVGKRCVTMTMLAVLLGTTVLVQPQPLLGLFPRRVFPDRPVMGPPLPFPNLEPAGLPPGVPAALAGLAHEPVNEMGVVFLFAILARRLGFIVDALQSGFPDCEARLEVEPGRWQRVRIEFEYESRKFRDHRHDPRRCDLIVCWRHNWPGCPRSLQVLELSRVVRSLAPSANCGNAREPMAFCPVQ